MELPPTSEANGIEHPPPSKLKALLLVLRLQFTVACLLPFAIGLWCVWNDVGDIDITIALMGLAVVMLCNMAGNVFNDYYDRESDRVGRPNLFSGGSGVIVAGALSPRSVLLYAMLLGAMALLGATLLQFLLGTGPWTVPIVVLGLLIVWAYSAPPIRLVARGLGEIAVAFSVAILVPLTAYYVQTGTVTLSLIAICLPLVPFIFLIMLSVHLPDYQSDVMANKTNLVVRLGIEPVKRLFIASLILPYILIVILSLSGLLELEQFILFASLPLAFLLGVKVLALRISDIPSTITINVLTLLLTFLVGLLEFSFVLLQG